MAETKNIMIVGVGGQGTLLKPYSWWNHFNCRI